MDGDISQAKDDLIQSDILAEKLSLRYGVLTHLIKRIAKFSDKAVECEAALFAKMRDTLTRHIEIEQAISFKLMDIHLQIKRDNPEIKTPPKLEITGKRDYYVEPKKRKRISLTPKTAKKKFNLESILD
jgi:hypothetical protein